MPDTIECPRDLLNECRAEIAQLIDDIGGCDHQVGICCCDQYRLLDWIDRTLAEANTTQEEPSR